MGPAGIHIKIRWKLLYGRAGIKLTVNLILHCLVGQVHHGSLALLHVQVVSGPAPRGFVITICRRVRNSVRWPGAGKCARNPYLFIFLNTFKYVSAHETKACGTFDPASPRAPLPRGRETGSAAARTPRACHASAAPLGVAQERALLAAQIFFPVGPRTLFAI